MNEKKSNESFFKKLPVNGKMVEDFQLVAATYPFEFASAFGNRGSQSACFGIISHTQH